MSAHDNHCTNWKAIHDFQPPRPARLRVTGQCTFATTGYSVELRKHEPQGINPTILMLDKIVHIPVDPGKPKQTVVEVLYEVQTAAPYTEVQILPDNVHIKVEDVS